MGALEQQCTRISRVSLQFEDVENTQVQQETLDVRGSSTRNISKRNQFRILLFHFIRMFRTGVQSALLQSSVFICWNHSNLRNPVHTSTWYWCLFLQLIFISDMDLYSTFTNRPVYGKRPYLDKNNRINLENRQLIFKIFIFLIFKCCKSMETKICTIS